MKNTTPTTNISPLPLLKKQTPQSAILVAYAKEGLEASDRFAVPDSLIAGRGSACNLTIVDKQISKQHFRIERKEAGTTIEDLGSTNGTYLNGRRLAGKAALPDQSVIRVGQVVLVFASDGRLLLEPPCPTTFGMAGHFHTNSLVNELNESALSTRSVLLAGPSGSGKELAARALRLMITGDESDPFVAHNAGLFATEDEATSTLFGVGTKIFSGVDSRVGLIDQANGGTLFLDEISNLPPRVQQSLLRVIEDGKTKRIGETDAHEANVRFIFASNKDDSNYGLAPDLFARLRLVRIPALRARTADIPSIFNAILISTLNKRKIDQSILLPLLSGDHYEALCLDGFERDNVRGLIDIADRIVTKITVGHSPTDALASSFNDRFHDGLVACRADTISPPEPEPENIQQNSHYEDNKETIIAVYNEQKGNVSATERILREKGITCSRRWIAIFMERWGVK